MKDAMGATHRRTNAEVAFHGFEKEFVIVVRTSHHLYGTTSHHITPLSIEAATDLHRQLGDALTDAMWENTDRSELPY
ncbi:hypothetical protein [Streptosporangium sp. G12]